MPTPYKGKLITIALDISAETLKAKKAKNDAFQALEVSNCQQELLYSEKLSFKNKIEIKAFQAIHGHQASITSNS